MRKSELIQKIAENTNASPKEVKEILRGLAEIITQETVKGGEVPLPDVGKFKVRRMSARVGRNPKSGETLQIPAKRKLHFVCSKELKEKIANN